MTKEKFINLDTIDKINYINSKLEEGQTVIRIREDLGIGERSLQKEIRDFGYVYSQKHKQYIPKEKTTTQTTTESTTKDLNVEVVATNTNTLLTKEKSNTLDYLVNNIDVLMDMIEKYKTTTESTTQTTTNYITIDLVDDKHLKPKPKSIRLNEFVYQEWQEFCEEEPYSKMDLHSMALKEYMMKYRRKK